MDAPTFWRPPFRRLIWLLPVAFAPHIAEEYLGGFPNWVTHVLGGSFSNLAFALNNAVFMFLMIVFTAWASRSGSRLSALILIAWASANIFWDGLFHIVMTAARDRYSPGLITAAVLYMPIFLAVGWSALESRTLNLGPFLGAIVAGLAMLGLVIWYGLFHFAT